MAFTTLAAFLLVLPADSYGNSTYTLSVVSEPANLLHINGDGEYEADEYATTGTAPNTWMGYEFVGWKVDGVMYAGNPASILMDGDHKAVAVYAKQKTTITVDSYPRVSSVLVDDVTYLSSDLPLKFDWDPSSTHSIVFPEKVNSKTFTRYVFAGWNDDLAGRPSRELTVDGSKTIKAFFGTQYYLKLVSEHGEVSGSGWYDDGSIASISVSSQYQEGAVNGSRFVFAGWAESAGASFDSQNSQVIVDKPVVMTAQWEEQNLLELRSSIKGVDLFGEGWYKKGSAASVIAPQQFQENGRDCKFAFNGWTLTGPTQALLENAGTTLNRMTVNIDNPYTAVAGWKELCYLKIADPMQKTSGQGYYEVGSAVTVTIAQEVQINEDARLVPYSLTIISGVSKEVPITEKDSSMSITIDGPTMVQTNWKKQYHVNVSSDRGVTRGSGWYDEGSVATIGMKQSRDPAGFLNQYKFSHWEGDAIPDEHASMSLVVDGPKELRAVWVEDVASEVFNAGIIIVTVSIGALFYVKFRNQIRSYTSKLAGENPSGMRQVKRDEL